MQEREKLLTSDLKSLFFKLSIPGMIGMVVIGLYNFVDAIFVGQLVGKEAVGAVALMYAVVLFNQALLTLIGSGSMSVLSIAMGKKDQAKIDKLLGNMIVLLVLISGLFTIFVAFNTDSIVRFVGGKGLTHELGVRYLKILLIGFIPAALGPAMNFLLRAEGKMRDAMIIMGTFSILNIILDPIFIKTLGYGIEGAAIATIISQYLLMITQFVYFGMGRSIISLNKIKLRVERDVLPEIFKVGFSQMLMCVMAMVQQIILFNSLQAYGGNDHVSLMGGSYRVFMFAYLAVWGIGQGLQSVVGVNYGAGRYDRVKNAFKQFTLIGSLISVSVWILFMVFPENILSWFIPDPKLVADNVNLFRLFTSIFFLYVYFATVLNFFIGLGKGKEAGVIAISRQIVFFIPLALVLPKFMGVTGIWLSLPLSDLLCMILAVFYQKRIFLNDLVELKAA
ncbi:MAG: MATE family efflux transporter [Tissierellales bacterium]|jgi:putative MATE family efflux protein|nr:MATE family efflux transporter [Tissierellales bacterium]